jgi:hypothetical protein
VHRPCELPLLPLLLLLLPLPLPLPFQVIRRGGTTASRALQLRLAARLAPRPKVGLRARHAGGIGLRRARRVVLMLQRRLCVPWLCGRGLVVHGGG